VTESWINVFLDAVAEAEQVERHHTELSEKQAAGLLQWCLNGSSGSPSSTGPTGTGSAVSASCTMCGEPAVVPALEAGHEDRGDPLDHWWLCPGHRSSMAAIMGSSGSPGRPERSAHDQRVDRYARCR
jgi:hypothetical protein